MNAKTEYEIEKLTVNLPAIRKVAGWSSEELGELIGVTKQTVSNIETRKSKMSKTQYIAIRAVIDCEIAENPDNELLPNIVNLLLNSGESPDDKYKADAARNLIDSTARSAISGGMFSGIADIISAFFGCGADVSSDHRARTAPDWMKKICER